MSHADPRMSPLFIREWARRKDSERVALIESLKPKPKLQPGDSFQVDVDGSFIPLEPGKIVPPKPVREEQPRNG